jgi:hypothetical protein
MSYWPQKTGEHVSKERFKKYEYDDEHRRENPGLRDGLPPEFLEVLDLEEAHRKKMPNLETFLRNPPKLDDASLCVDKIYEMPPA